MPFINLCVNHTLMFFIDPFIKCVPLFSTPDTLDDTYAMHLTLSILTLVKTVMTKRNISLSDMQV